MRDGEARRDRTPSLEELCATIRSGLEEGGPPVNEPDLCAYCEGMLRGTAAAQVRNNILRWRNWFVAYRQICSDSAIYEDLVRQLDDDNAVVKSEDATLPSAELGGSDRTRSQESPLKNLLSAMLLHRLDRPIDDQLAFCMRTLAKTREGTLSLDALFSEAKAGGHLRSRAAVRVVVRDGVQRGIFAEVFGEQDSDQATGMTALDSHRRSTSKADYVSLAKSRDEIFALTCQEIVNRHLNDTDQLRRELLKYATEMKVSEALLNDLAQCSHEVLIALKEQA